MAGASARDEADLYDRDLERWAELQVRHLRHGRPDLPDRANLIEEVGSLGKAQLFALRSPYTLIAIHLLKQMKPPEKATANWENTINRERGNVVEMLQDNPGVRPKRAEAFAKACRKARSDAAFEARVDLRSFPVAPPFTPADVEAAAWWPPGFPSGRSVES